MPALFESEWDGQDNSNYGWSAVSIYRADGTETGQSAGVVVDAFGDRVVPDADVPRLIAALQAYAEAQGIAAVAAPKEDTQALADGQDVFEIEWTLEVTERWKRRFTRAELAGLGVDFPPEAGDMGDFASDELPGFEDTTDPAVEMSADVDERYITGVGRPDQS